MNNTILIIDDDNALRQSLVKGLTNAGFTVLDAASAETAKQILQKIKFDAIVLDRMMTGEDGLTFLKKIRSRGNNTPVLMLTAMAGAENTIDGLSGGANDYLAKPFQLQELILRLQNIIKSNITNTNKMPTGLNFTDDEFFITDKNGESKVLGLSGEEKRLLVLLTSPVGNTAVAQPMVAKRLRTKINGVLSNIDIITVRGAGYKIIELTKGA